MLWRDGGGLSASVSCVVAGVLYSQHARKVGVCQRTREREMVGIEHIQEMGDRVLQNVKKKIPLFFPFFKELIIY